VLVVCVNNVQGKGSKPVADAQAEKQTALKKDKKVCFLAHSLKKLLTFFFSLLLLSLECFALSLLGQLFS